MPLRYAAVGAELRNWHHASGGSKAHLGGFSAPGRHRRYLLGTDASSGTNDTSSSGSGGSAGKMLYCALKAIKIYVHEVIFIPLFHSDGDFHRLCICQCHTWERTNPSAQQIRQVVCGCHDR